MKGEFLNKEKKKGEGEVEQEFAIDTSLELGGSSSSALESVPMEDSG